MQKNEEEVSFQQQFIHDWEIVRTCVRLLNAGQAHIVVKTMPSGKRSRYTRIIKR